jgi:putative Mg2+ transporter-C (MgtC) family protein
VDAMDASQMASEYGVRLLAAAGMGGVIGFEREAKARPAGLRTHMLTAVAAALFTVMTIEMHQQLLAQKHQGGDPIRIIEAITVGVSFLAAGTIIQRGRNVHGITTGAGLWLAGAAGMTAGFGEYLIGAMAVGLALIILTGLGFIEDRFYPNPPPEPVAEKRSAKKKA